MRLTDCVVCGGGSRGKGGSPGRVGHLVDHFGEVLCRRCAGGPRCSGCDATTGGIGPRSPTVLPDGRLRCRRCSQGAVDSPADLGRVVGLVRPLLHSYGIRLPNRVTVELAPLAELERRAGSPAHGLTTVLGWGAPATVVSLRVAEGLPATVCGEVLAHEMGHGWLAGCPGRRDVVEEEGICQLVAGWWLRHRGGPLAAHRLDAMARDPHPTYGDGYRRSLRRAGRRSPAAVVAHVTRTGHL